MLLGLLTSCGSTVEKPAKPAPPRPAPSLVDVDDDAEVEVLEPEDLVVTSPGVVDTSPPATPQDEATLEEEENPSAVLGWVAGAPLTATDLVLEWHGVASQEVFLVLEKLISTRLVLAEAQRLGIKLTPEEVELRFTQERARFAKQVAETDPEVSVENYIRSSFGMQPTTYFSRLRTSTIRQMLAERVVRAYTLGNEWTRVRMIVVASEAEAEEASAQLAAGADFAGLAREISLDDTSADGGLVPFLLRQEGSALSVAAFAARPGELVGPIPFSGHQVLMRIEERRPPLAGDWNALGLATEASLREYTVRDGEFVNWKLNMERRYPIDVEPLKQLLGIDG